MAIAAVTRELLVRYLETWAPGALHAARGATFAQAWSGAPDVEAAESALRVFADLADRRRGRRLTIVLVAPETSELTGRSDYVHNDLPADVSVHAAAGTPEAVLPAALRAAGAAGAPLLVFLDVDAPSVAALKAVAAGRPAELLLVSADSDWPAHRTALRAAGFTLSAGVELVGGTETRLLAFATSSLKALEAFKNALWSADEFAGVRYRDPTDPDGHLLDISLRPHPGPLRRELLAYLADAGGSTVTDLRRFTLTETVYRAADTTAALTKLLSTKVVIRDPATGRLGGDVMISLA
jgi:hypothetical protein